MNDLQLPTIIWPKQSEEYKIVQFVKGNAEDINENNIFLRFAPTPTSDKDGWYHSGLVRLFCEEIGIKPIYKDLGSIDQVATIPQESPFKFVGAGACDVYLDEKVALFGSSSGGYQMGVNQIHIDALSKLFPEWIMNNNIFYNRKDRFKRKEYTDIDWNKLSSRKIPAGGINEIYNPANENDEDVPF